MINIKKILSILLAVITVITLIPTSVYALTWDGASTSGNNSASSGNITGYAIRTSGDNCIGYRFSCVDANGNMKTLKVIDVFRDTGYGNLGYSDGYKFATKYNIHMTDQQRLLCELTVSHAQALGFSGCCPGMVSFRPLVLPFSHACFDDCFVNF